MESKLHKTERKQNFLFTHFLSVLLETWYWMRKVFKLSQPFFLWCSVCRIIGTLLILMVEYDSVQCTFTDCLLRVGC